MRVNYINFNGRLLVDSEPVLTTYNRSFRYGDGLFETMLWMDRGIRFVEYHAERLQKGLQTLRIDGWERFDAEFIHRTARELLTKNELDGRYTRIRLQVFRSGSGLYSPVSNQPVFVMGAEPVAPETYQASGTRKSGLIIDLYTEQIKAYSGLSHLKSTNSQVYVLAGLFRKQKGLDEVIILNQDGHVCETMSSNIFVAYGDKIYTPALSEGCVAGVMRRAVLELQDQVGAEIVEAKIDPMILPEADEIFLTNAVRGVQWVMGYRQKRYFNKWSKLFLDILSCQAD